MSKLKAFLQPSVAGITREVMVSDRFKDENGEAQPFVIQAIGQDENERLADMSRVEQPVSGMPINALDNVAYTRRLLKACVKDPDLSDSELCKYYGTMDPEEVLGKMLSIGEYQLLTEEVLNINGVKGRREKMKAAKNS